MLYKTILINLEKDKNRLEYMNKQLSDFDLSFERFNAVNGKEYLAGKSTEYDEKLAIKIGGRSLKPGEIGCALSHKRCYEKFLYDEEYKDTKYLLILEDDITLDKNFKDILEKELEKNEKNYRWNYLQFNYTEIGSPKNIFKSYILKTKIQYFTLRSKKNILTKLKRVPYLFFAPFVSTILNLRNYFVGLKPGSYKFLKILPLTGAYIVDKKVAKVMLDLTRKVTEALDITTVERLKNHDKNLNFYFYTPIIAKQNYEDFESGIEHEKL